MSSSSGERICTETTDASRANVIPVRIRRRFLPPARFPSVPSPGSRANNGLPDAYPPTAPASLNTGRYIAMTSPPMTTPRKTISIGSSSAVIASTAESTSSS